MVLVCGATGDLGGAIARLLLARGAKVRALARPQSNYRRLADAGAEVVLGDLKDRGSLDAVCRGVSSVITTANSARRGGVDNPTSVDLEGNRNLIDAAKAAGARHFVFVSALGVRSDSPSSFLAAKARTEEALAASGMGYTILAPDAFMEVWIAHVVGGPAMSGQPVPIIGDGSRRHSFISALDVARFALAALDNPAALGRRLPLGGPQALSFMDAVRTYERILGRPVPVVRVEPGEAVPGVPPVAAAILAGMEIADSVVEMGDTARTYGVKLTSLEEFVRASVARGSE